MSWLRIDDQRCLHPKVGELSDREYRALDALYEYCARTNNSGYYHEADLRHAVYVTPTGPRSPTRKTNEKWLQIGLVDEVAGGLYRVHDWDDYQPKDPTGAQRKRLERERKQGSPQDSVTGQSQDNDVTGHAKNRDSRARGPVPSRPKEEENPKAVTSTYNVDDDEANGLGLSLEEEDPEEADYQRAQEMLERTAAALASPFADQPREREG